MDHAEAREALDLAAVEPGGLDRLVAGDTPAAAALAGHLAGCEACTLHMVRLRRDAGLIRDVVLTTPRPELRERTLAYVAQVGRPRLDASPAGPVTPKARSATVAGRWVAALAAVLVAAVAVTAALVAAPRDRLLAEQQARLDRQQAAVTGLTRVTTMGLAVASQPDVRHVELAGTGTLAGTILYSPSTEDLVVVAGGLEPASEGREYRCWVEVDGQRRPVGRMFFGGDLAFWAGPVAATDLAGAERFGVTLVEAAGTSLDGPPVLEGEL